MVEIDVDELKENTWKQFELDINHGGMGGNNLDDVRLSAFMASFAGFYKEVSNRNLLDLDNYISGGGGYNGLQSKHITQFCGCYQEFSMVDAVKFPVVLSMEVL